MSSPDETTMPGIGILLWNTCNARCEHCMPECGPQDRHSLDNDEIFSIIDGAIELYGVKWVLGLSGGEPFLYRDRLEQIIGYRSNERYATSIVTNGFWALSEKVAEDVLKPLVEVGLSAISLSVSRYHFEYVHPERVENAILVAQKLGINTGIKAVVSQDSRLPFVLGAIRRVKPWEGNVRVQLIDLIPEGRASKTSEIEPNYLDHLPSESCPAEVLTILPTGAGSPCCNGAGETKALDIGKVQQQSLCQIAKNLKTNPVMKILREEGPAALLPQLPPDEEQKLRNSKWVNVCHLCCEVLKTLPADSPV